jgi:hypothetical protein
MTATPIRLQLPSVTVSDDALHIADLSVTDAEVVQVVAQAADPEQATHLCLQVGARAVRAANVAVDVDLVERAFSELTSRFDAQVSEYVGQLSDTAVGLLDGEDGALSQTLVGFGRQIGDLLGSTFDPDSKASVVSKIETMVQELVERNADAMRKMLVTEGSDAPLARLKSEIVADVKTEIGDVVREVRDVSEKLGIAAATAEVLEKTSGKGFTFEEEVDHHVCELAAVHGDLAERVGNETGTTASKVGDELVTLNRDDTRGLEARIVLEVKDRKLGTRAIYDELDEALENRDALAAIAVFSGQDKAPTSVPFHYNGNRAIVVLEKGAADTGALRLAYMWARMTARSGLCDDEETGEIDVERATELLEQARRTLERVSTVRRAHSTAKKAIDMAVNEVSELDGELRDAIDELERELCVT